MPRASGLAATMQPEQKVTPRCANSRGRDPRSMALSKKHRTTPRRFTAEERAEMVRLYTTPLPDGTWMGATTIARKLGINHQSVYYVLRTEGVQTRDAARAHAHGKTCRPVKNLPVGEAPPCKCGCGGGTAWNQRKNRWNAYVIGHYTQRGKQSHTYVHGRSHLPYAEGWPQISLSVRRRDGFRCQRCFGDSRNLHVHHRDCDKLNNSPDNLITLCASCHARTHAEMRKGVMPECQS